MDAATKNQQFHLILADIATAMAIRVHDAQAAIGQQADRYEPGAIRDAWFKQPKDRLLVQRVKALANAGIASLVNLEGPDLVEKAKAFGVPLTSALAEEIAAHFVARRNAVLTYNR